MPGARVENSPNIADRMRDISSWREGDIRSLSTRAKKKYYRRKSAIEDYFTSDISIDTIALRKHISSERLLQLAEQCLMQAEDGLPWGFRALMPGVNVIDYAVQSAAEEAPSPEIPAEDTQNLDHETQSDSSDETEHPSIPEAAAPASLGEDEETEDNDHDTVKLPAIKRSRPSVRHDAGAPPEAQPGPSLQVEGEEPASSIETAPELDESTTKLEPLSRDEEESVGENPVDLAGPADPIETAPELDESTTKLEPLSRDEEQASQEPEQSPAGEEEEHLEVEQAAVSEEVTLAANQATTDDVAESGEAVHNPKRQDEHEATVESMQIPPAGGETPGEPASSADSAEDERFMVPTDARDAITEVERILVEEKGEARTALPAFAGASKNAEKSLPAAYAPLSSLTMPVSLRRIAMNGKKAVAIQRRLVRKRWLRDERVHTKKQRSLQIVSFAILAAIILFVLVPVGAGVAAYSAYNNISGIAHDGINHLLKVKSLLPVSKSDPTAALNEKNLTQAQVEFKAAQSDFIQLQQLADRSDVQAAIAQFAPQYSNKLGMAQKLVQVALDVSRMGNELCGVALIGANIIHGSPLSSGSTKPVISAADFAAIEGSMVHALYYIDDIQQQMSQVSIKDIPVSDSQKKQLASVMNLLPTARNTIIQAQGLVGIVAWLLGVGQPRRFLVQTMDRAELRPGGGFTGQYGILQIQDGRMSPFNLTDVTLIDYAENGTAIGRTAPPGYSWMNFGNWGIRDSNLSGDFPTTARMTMQLFQDEGGGPVDGDIAFTPALIGHIIDVIGPIKVPGYNETITSKNLEERLHYYQQDFSAIAREKQISGNFTHAGRKAFTSTLGKLLLDRVRHAKIPQLLAIGKGAIKDIQSRDLEIYFTNPSAESWLVEHGYSGSIDTFTKQDGFMVVQANISISKASQYVHTTEQDNVTLDSQGGATHNLTITLDYQQKGPVYGFDTYADYIRVYAPRNAQLTGGDGFDTGKALCKPGPTRTSPVRGGTGTPVVAGCGQYNSFFPSNARNCPNGDYSLGMRGGLNTPWAIDSLGPPTALNSDLPGRAMWGGLTETPKNCISTISLSWYVPHAVQKARGQPSYTILVQKQSGYSPTIDLTIDASALKGLKSFSFNGDINADRLFTLSPPLKKNKA